MYRKADSLEAGVWIEKVTKGGRRFVAAGRKDEVDAAMQTSPGRGRGNDNGKLLSHTEA